MKRILLVAHHFPPDGAVGAIRPAKFAKYLPQFGWEPIVLTVKGSYHLVVDDPQTTNRHSSFPVIRCSFVRNPSYYYRALKRIFFGSLENATRPATSPSSDNRRPTIRDWINALLAFPDEDTGWIPFAMLNGQGAIRRFGIDCILTSGPPHSTHLIGAWLNRWTGLPWIVDFRDPLFSPRKRNLVSRRLDQKLEGFIMSRAALVLVTTERLREELARHHPAYADKVHTLLNGYDPDDFAAVPRQKAEKFTISYLGTLYGYRDPEPVLRAVAGLIDDGLIQRERIILRFAGDCENAAGKPMRSLIDQYGLNENVELSSWLPKQRAFEIMAQSHVLLLLAEDQELMIPAKVYDYFGLGVDILALTEDGATADLLREVKQGIVTSPNNFHLIKENIRAYYETYLRSPADSAPCPSKTKASMSKYERRRQVQELAQLLDQLVVTTPFA